MDTYIIAYDISSSVRLLAEYGCVTTDAKPTRRSPIQVLTCTYVDELHVASTQLFVHWANGT